MATQDLAPLVAVEFDLYDGSAIRTLRLSSSTLTATIGGVHVQYEPMLRLPIIIGARINGEQYGTPLRGAPNGGQIEFLVNATLWSWLAYHWRGRTFRVRSGQVGDRYDDMVLIYEGRIDDLAFDTASPVATVRTTDAGLDFDKPLIEELYGTVLGEAASGDTAQSTPGAGVIFLRQFSPDFDCTLSWVNIVPRTTDDDAKFRAVLYTDNAGVPDAVLSDGVEVVGCEAGHLAGELVTHRALTKDTPYWIGFHIDTAVDLSQVDGAFNGRKKTVAYSAGAPISIGSTTTAIDWEVWGTNINAATSSDDTEATAPSSIVGLPKPRLYGEARSIAPLLEDQQQLIYRISDAAITVTEVRVGGVIWTYKASDPAAGEWTYGAATGTILLGAVTLGAEVRVDARSSDYATLTTAGLIRQIVEDKGGTVDEAAMTALDAAVPGRIGYWCGAVININDLLDAIVFGAGSWWARGPDAKVTAGVIDEPAAIVDLALTKVEIASLRLAQLVAPAWRIRIEYARNWAPASSFLASVSEFDQARLSATGIMAPAWKDAGVKTAEPRAVDVPVIRSLFLEEADAIAVRDRLQRAWSVERRLYDVTMRVISDAVDLYDTASVDYPVFANLSITGNYRAHSAVRSIGGGDAAVQLWG